MKKLLVPVLMAAIILALVCSPALAFEPIPNESGFDGFVRLGGGYSWVKSNMVAGSALGDVSQKKINSIKDEPNSKSSAIPQLNWNVKYTFASTRTQLFAGDRLEDVFRFTATTQAGVRQEFDRIGITGISFVFSTLPTDVWKDPYVTNKRRKKTDRTSKGIRLAWEHILNSNFDLDYTYRKINVDKERSGKFLGLSGARKNRLDRSGANHQLKGAYFYKIGKQHIISPAVILDSLDLDGSAMRGYTGDFQLTYAYFSDKIDVSVNGLIGYADYDKKNPVYNKTRNNTRYGGGVLASWKNPFGWEPFGIEKFRLYGQTGYFSSDSNIDFYDTHIFQATVGVWIDF
jgi:hypothetical protein